MADETDRLLGLFDSFRTLNPEIAELVEREFFEIVETVPPDDFERIRVAVAEIVQLYLNSPFKAAGHAIVSDYYSFITKTTQKMIADGQLPSAASEHPSAMALVPANLYTPLQWFQITDRAQMPLEVVHGFDAVQRHNTMTRSVLEPLFKALLIIDAERAFQWQLTLCGSVDEPCDPDIARDLLRAWTEQEEVPRPALRQAMLWSEDPAIVRHWPEVIREADRLLRVQTLRRWIVDAPEANSQIKHLGLLAPFTDDSRLSRWHDRTIELIGNSITFFATQAEQVQKDDAEWRQYALFRELKYINELMPTTLLLSDLLLSEPAGSYHFGMAVFGFTREVKNSWSKELEEQCRYLVRRWFLTDLKSGKTPKDTITRLCFGDPTLRDNLFRELDIMSEEFDSISQRELVVDRLGANYASFREPGLLTGELGRRYRQMMRVLHEDNLRRVLGNDQFEEAQSMKDVLLDISVMTNESRRFLNLRQALENTTEEIVAADLDFARKIRDLRATTIHRILGC